MEWRAEEYDVVAKPHGPWAEQVLSRVELRGDETVLDAGCGTGVLTELVVDRVPDGRVIGTDASAAMLEQARRNLGPRVELIHSDLVTLELSEPVDVVVSSAVFHWIGDHQRLFERLHAALKPGGRLEAQCGGQGNIAEVERAVESLAGDERFAPYLRTERQAWNYASIGDTELRLARAGYEHCRAWIEPWPVMPRDARRYLATFILPWHLERLPDDRHDAFVDAVLGSSPRPFTANYMRLNISARRPG